MGVAERATLRTQPRHLLVFVSTEQLGHPQPLHQMVVRNRSWVALNPLVQQFWQETHRTILSLVSVVAMAGGTRGHGISLSAPRGRGRYSVQGAGPTKR